MTMHRKPPVGAGEGVPGGDPTGYMIKQFDGSHIWFTGGLLTFKAKAPDTGGVLSFFECDVPYGWQSAVHRHANEAELFYVTEGTLEVYVRDTVHEATAGSTVWIPANTAHSIFVSSPKVRALCVVTPGGLEGFFEDGGEEATVASMPTQETWMPSVPELQELGDKYGWELVEPQPRRLSS